MSNDTQPSNLFELRADINKILHYQQNQRNWTIARFALGALFVLMIGISLTRQLHVTWSGRFNASQQTAELINKPHIALIDLKGPIWGSFDSAMPSTADNLLPSLRGAFANEKVVAVVLRINSPGGTTVQSNQISTEIRRLRKIHPEIPIYAVCEEICASAAYHIASACHEIYANPASIIGSLGVTLSGPGFGYDKALKKLGIDRRLITAGDKKGMLDPYLPLNEQDVQIIKSMQSELHQLFIQDVKRGRGIRLKEVDNEKTELFSGRTWVGTQALELGLIDQLGGIELIENECKVAVLNYTPKPDWLFHLRKVAGLNLSTSEEKENLSKGLGEPLLGLAPILRDLQEPISALL